MICKEQILEIENQILAVFFSQTKQFAGSDPCTPPNLPYQYHDNYMSQDPHPARKFCIIHTLQSVYCIIVIIHIQTPAAILPHHVPLYFLKCFFMSHRNLSISVAVYFHHTPWQTLLPILSNFLQICQIKPNRFHSSSVSHSLQLPPPLIIASFYPYTNLNGHIYFSISKVIYVYNINDNCNCKSCNFSSHD